MSFNLWMQYSPHSHSQVDVNALYMSCWVTQSDSYETSEDFQIQTVTMYDS